MNKKFLNAVDKLKTVTIPNIGTIVKIGSKYSLNHFLKYNDGRFSKYLQENEGIIKDDADLKVKVWCEQIINDLNSIGHYNLEGIGIIKQEAIGKYSMGHFQDNDSDINEKFPLSDLEMKMPIYEEGYLSKHFNVKRAKEEIIRIKNLYNKKNIVLSKINPF